MNDNNIDPNKIIGRISDCKGTCKTPIGCTCQEFDEMSDKLSPEPQKLKLVLDKEVKLDNQSTEKRLVENNALKSSNRCSKVSKNSCCCGSNKLEVYNWLNNLPPIYMSANLVEVQFKNTRKEYYVNSNDLELYKGDIVVVEATPGHDVGEVTLTGKLVELQMKKVNYRGDVKRIYRVAKQSDIDKYNQFKEKEHPTMLRAREIAEELKLDMKISDVEYQGDGNKIIFYYIADGRVDFRQLIKHYATQFKSKIEMKQIGARQEAGRVGGIGPCGRELCCSSSMSNFVSVSTSAARVQDIPLNPQKLAGQCGKLKCCMNFEVDVYVEAQRNIPHSDIVLETKDGSYYFFKSDVLKGQISYSTDKHFPANLVTISTKRASDVIALNKRGEKPMSIDVNTQNVEKEVVSTDLLENESITRFDAPKKNNGRRNNRRRKEGNSERENDKVVQNKVPNNNEPDRVNSNTNNNNRRNRRDRNKGIAQDTGQRKNIENGNKNTNNGKKVLNKNTNNNETPPAKPQ